MLPVFVNVLLAKVGRTTDDKLKLCYKKKRKLIYCNGSLLNNERIKYHCIGACISHSY